MTDPTMRSDCMDSFLESPRRRGWPVTILSRPLILTNIQPAHRQLATRRNKGLSNGYGTRGSRVRSRVQAWG
jgi:hypothetical protein